MGFFTARGWLVITCHGSVTAATLIAALESQAAHAQTSNTSAQPTVAAPTPQPTVAAPTPQPTVAASMQPPSDKPPQHSFGVDLAASYVSEVGSTSFILAPVLEGAIALHRKLLIDVMWGAAWMLDNQGLSESTGRLGNPMAAGIFRTEHDSWRLRAGLGFTAPLAHYPLGYDGRLYAFVYNQAMSMWGFWNQWLWAPDRMAVPATGWFGYTLPHGQVLIAEAAVAPVFGERGTATGTTFVGQIAVEASIPLVSNFALHPRLQTVMLPSTSVDRFQTAAGLRVSYRTSVGRFFAGVLVNVDRPLGFQGLGRWGFHIGKEVEL